ncbi:helix-turn-helix domain-containing protein [Actinokineospora inagensis]|uniref:helix-turn-helix domain-containing protein n=1 Tax=Actinokineospora inagensis TaxID=103730 RepID=UPI00042A8AD6|nr:helix-turn-helix transcriptional regulator [Actinokineospora inagensis]
MTAFPQDQDEVLRKETFSEALRAAIHRRDLTLDRIRSRLAARGVDVSLATLSYWQQGRSRPERAKSLRALRELEAILNLPSNALFDLLDPPKPRGRLVGLANGVTGARLYGDNSPIRGVLGGSFEHFNDGIQPMSLAETCEVDASRSLRRITTVHVLRAIHPDQDRFLVVHGVDEGDAMPTDIRVHTGHLGDTRIDTANGFFAADIHFGRVLAKNETTIVEYETVLGESPTPSRFHEHRFRTPVHSVLLRARFAPDALPARCYAYYRDSVPSSAKQRRRLAIDGSHTVHSFLPRCAPGVHGFSWQW